MEPLKKNQNAMLEIFFKCNGKKIAFDEITSQLDTAKESELEDVNTNLQN